MVPIDSLFECYRLVFRVTSMRPGGSEARQDRAGLTQMPINGRILLIILFPRYVAAMTMLDSRNF
jgi:hypothetical protein